MKPVALFLHPLSTHDPRLHGCVPSCEAPAGGHLPRPILELVQECQETSSQSSPGRAPGQQHQLRVQAENNKAAVPRQKVYLSM